MLRIRVPEDIRSFNVLFPPHPLTPRLNDEERNEQVQGQGLQYLPAPEHVIRASNVISELLRPLSSEEQSLICRAVYGPGPDHEILAAHKSDSVKRSSMRSLQPEKWLNDEVMNYFHRSFLSHRDEQLCASDPGRTRSHFFSTYFVQMLFDEKNSDPELRGTYNYDNVKRWGNKVSGKDIFRFKYVFCPINLDNSHWTMAIIFMKERRIQYYDSFGGTDERKLKGLLQYLKDEHKAKKGKELEGEWKLVGCPEDSPRQMNGEGHSSHCNDVCDLIYNIGICSHPLGFLSFFS